MPPLQSSRHVFAHARSWNVYLGVNLSINLQQLLAGLLGPLGDVAKAILDATSSLNVDVNVSARAPHPATPPLLLCAHPPRRATTMQLLLAHVLLLPSCHCGVAQLHLSPGGSALRLLLRGAVALAPPMRKIVQTFNPNAPTRFAGGVGVKIQFVTINGKPKVWPHGGSRGCRTLRPGMIIMQRVAARHTNRACAPRHNGCRRLARSSSTGQSTRTRRASSTRTACATRCGAEPCPGRGER